jgi:hypothetical protein
VLGWPNICKLAHAFRWEYSYKMLKLAQLLGQFGAFLTDGPAARPGADDTFGSAALRTMPRFPSKRVPSTDTSWHELTSYRVSLTTDRDGGVDKLIDGSRVVANRRRRGGCGVVFMLCYLYPAWTWCKTAKGAYLEMSSSSKHICNMLILALQCGGANKQPPHPPCRYRLAPPHCRCTVC